MKKLIALLLALVMVLSLVACTAKEEPEQEEEKPADSEQKPAEDKKEEDKKEDQKEEEKQEEKEEPAEQEIVPGELPLVADGEEAVITIGLPQSVNTENYETNDYTLWIEESTGVDLQFVYFSTDSTEMKTQLNLMLSSGQELPDILWNLSLDTFLVAEYGEEGYFVDMTEYFDKYAHYFWEGYNEIDETAQKNLFTYAKSPIDGCIYAFPHYQQLTGDGPVTLASINQKWLDAVGEDVPTNVDELYNVLKKFAEEDPNGNGLKDELPMIGYTGYRSNIIEFVINAYVYCNDTFYFNAKDGQIYLPYMTDEYREAMIYLNKLYAEGLLSPMIYTIAEDAEMKAIHTPEDGVALAGVVGGHPVLTMDNTNEVLMEYTTLPPLAAESDLGGYGAMHPNTYRYRIFITSDCDDPVLAFRLLDFMSCEEAWYRMRFGVKDVHWCEPDEDGKTSLGYPAGVKIIDWSPWTSQNNVLWHQLDGNLQTYYRMTQAVPSDDPIAAHNSNLCNNMLYSYQDAGMPDEVVYQLVYLEDENEVVSELQAPIMDYILEAQAEFISGVLDPNDDKQWEEYLGNLESQGVNDWIAAAQSAYTRMNG